MNATAPRRRVTDAFDPMAVGMLARYAPSTLAEPWPGHRTQRGADEPVRNDGRRVVAQRP